MEEETEIKLMELMNVRVLLMKILETVSRVVVM
jgi:hypothetical protein